MKGRLLLGGAALLAIVVIGTAYFSTSVPSTPSAPAPVATFTPSPAPMPSPASAPTPKGYTMAQVATHNSASSCWSAINGKVYDLTSWVNQHPGGSQPILSLCGIDGSAAFDAQHGGQRRPANELGGFLIGALAQ